MQEQPPPFPELGGTAKNTQWKCPGEREEQLWRAELRQGSVTLDTLRGISNLSKEVDAVSGEMDPGY